MALPDFEHQSDFRTEPYFYSILVYSLLVIMVDVTIWTLTSSSQPSFLHFSGLVSQPAVSAFLCPSVYDQREDLGDFTITVKEQQPPHQIPLKSLAVG